MSPATLAALGACLSALSTVALGAGAWFFRRLVSATDDLRKEITYLRESLATLIVQRDYNAAAIEELKSDHKELSDRVRALEVSK